MPRSARPGLWLLAGCLSAGLALAPSTIAPASAAADTTFSVSNTGDGLYLHPSSPSIHSETSELMADGTNFAESCWQVGDSVGGDVVWGFGTDLSTGNVGFAADYFLSSPTTHGNEPAELTALGIPQCDTGNSGQQATTAFDRDAAVEWYYANAGHAPLIQNGGDCTWFVTQGLWAGGLPTSQDWAKDSANGVLGNDFEALAKALVHGGYSPLDPINPTIDATNADDLVNYLVDSGLATKSLIDWSDNTADHAQKGDLIAYDWDNGSNGVIDHVAAVTNYAEGTINPTVTQHSPERIDRYWSWSPDDQAFIENVPRYQPEAGSSNGPPKAYLIHIVY